MEQLHKEQTVEEASLLDRCLPATIQERNRYGSLGFNKIYECSTSDFSIAVKVLHQFLSQYDAVPWQALKTMIGGVVYGGRVTDDWDRRCMNALLDKFLNPDVLEDGYAYDTEGQYSSLNLCDFENVFDQIKALPAEDSPSIFGFHPTALNTLHLNKSEQMMNWILGVQPRLCGGDAAAKDDEIVLSLAEDLDQQLISEISLKGANQELLEEKIGSFVMNSLMMSYKKRKHVLVYV